VPFVVTHNLLPLRGRPESSAEMVSQALFGDTVDPVAEVGEFLLVTTEDGYEGWARRRHISEQIGSENKLQPGIVSHPFAVVQQDLNCAESIITRLSIGSKLSVITQTSAWTEIWLNNAGKDGSGYLKTEAVIEVPSLDSTVQDLPNRVGAYARSLLGTPYLWGGTSAFGLDCSGFVQRVFGLCGVLLPRDAYQQAAVSYENAAIQVEPPYQMGDIVFFLGREDPRQRGVTHVGIALDKDRFIHAYGVAGVSIHAFLNTEIEAEYLVRGGLRVSKPGMYAKL